MANTLTINGHQYEVDGAYLIAERYDDGVELSVYCTSDMDHLTRAVFLRRGPRGAKIALMLGGDLQEVTEYALRLVDARRHISKVDAYRKERWGVRGVV